jgi:DNA helicase HerA-like ATPase
MELTDINILALETEKGDNPNLEEVRNLFGEENVVSYPGAYLIPQLGSLPWDGHIYVSGATGAGKSYLIRQIVENDLSTRKVYLFSNVKDDPSLILIQMKRT